MKNRRRNRNPFRSQIIDYLWRYDEIKEICGPTSKRVIDAIDEVIGSANTEEEKVRVKIIDIMYIKKTKNVYGVSRELHMSRSSIYREVNKFVRDVCVKSKLIKA